MPHSIMRRRRAIEEMESRSRAAKRLQGFSCLKDPFEPRVRLRSSNESRPERDDERELDPNLLDQSRVSKPWVSKPSMSLESKQYSLKEYPKGQSGLRDKVKSQVGKSSFQHHDNHNKQQLRPQHTNVTTTTTKWVSTSTNDTMGSDGVKNVLNEQYLKVDFGL